MKTFNAANFPKLFYSDVLADGAEILKAAGVTYMWKNLELYGEIFQSSLDQNETMQVIEVRMCDQKVFLLESKRFDHSYHSVDNLLEDDRYIQKVVYVYQTREAAFAGLLKFISDRLQNKKFGNDSI